MPPLAIRKIVLAELATYGDALTQGALLTLVQLRLPKFTMADLRDELTWLRDRELAACVADPLEPDNRDARSWTITQAGQLALKK